MQIQDLEKEKCAQKLFGSTIELEQLDYILRIKYFQKDADI
jgi:hypothetical protein